MAKLTLTQSGNWAKQTTITRGGKWRYVGRCFDEEAAEQLAAIHRAKGRKVEIIPFVVSEAQSKRWFATHKALAMTRYEKEGLRGEAVTARATELKPIAPGTGMFRVEAYIGKTKQVMIHATAAECRVQGKTPGPANLD